MTNFVISLVKKECLNIKCERACGDATYEMAHM